MKIVVCIKQVPDTKGGVKFNPDGTLDRAAMLAIMNPDDKAGLEAALRIKDEIGAEVTVLTMGLPKADDVLREALAMGADNAILVTDRVLGGADTWATSTTIAGALRNIDYDLIITGRQAIDGDTAQVGPQIAEHLGIPVISYDRLLMNSDAVSYYATFDNYKVGQKQGEYLVDALDLDNQDGPFNIELFTGDPGDNNCNFFFGGAMDVLQKYIDEGKLVVKSGQTEFEQVATANWDSAKAQDRMDTIIAGNYSDGTNLDAVLCSNDSTALGVENALAASYTGEYPIITGQDCDTPNVKNLVAGKQAMSVFKDTRALASAVVKMVDSIMKGEEPEVNDTKSYDNGTGVIPTYLCDPVVVTVDNYKEILIDSGYYTEDRIK